MGFGDVPGTGGFNDWIITNNTVGTIYKRTCIFECSSEQTD